MPKETRMLLRAAPVTWGRSVRVDRKALVIYDTVAMKANVEAIGHGCMTDLKSLQLAAALTQKHRGGLGVQGRFGHPGASENSAGRKIMTCRNFRVMGDRLVHDIHLMPEARKSPAFGGADAVEYVLDMADTQPTEIAESFVMNVALVWVMGDGRELDLAKKNEWRKYEQVDEDGRPINATSALPIMRPTKVFYLDLVNEGALTHDGLFSSEVAEAMFLGTSNSAAAQAFDFVDQWREDYGIPLESVPLKVDQMVRKYMSSRGLEMAETKRGNRTKATTTRARQMDTTPGPGDDDLLGDDEETSEGDPVEDGDGDLNDDLDQIEQDSEQAAENSEPEAEPNAPSGDERLAALEQSVAEQQAVIKRLTGIVGNQARALKNLTQRQDSLEGEPIQTQRVGKVRQLSTRTPSGQPPQRLLDQRPDKRADTLSTVPKNGSARGDDEDALAVMNANARRNAATGR